MALDGKGMGGTGRDRGVRGRGREGGRGVHAEYLAAGAAIIGQARIRGIFPCQVSMKELTRKPRDACSDIRRVLGKSPVGAALSHAFVLRVMKVELHRLMRTFSYKSRGSSHAS